MRLTTIKKFSVLAGTAAFLSACSTVDTQVQGYNPSVSLRGLQQNTSAQPTLVYIRRGAPTLGAYNRFIIDPVRVSYSDPNMRELDNDQIQRMQRTLQAKLIAELMSAGYSVGTRSGPNTMRISMTIANLKAPTALPNVSAAFVPFSLNVGEVTVEAVFRQSSTNRIDAVVVNTSRGSRLLKSKPWSTWADVEASFQEWATGIRKAVDRAHGK